MHNALKLTHILAAERADAIARQADIVAAMTLEVLKGTQQAFRPGTYNNTQASNYFIQLFHPITFV